MGLVPVAPSTVDAPAGVSLVTLFARELAVYTFPKASTATEFGPAPVVPSAEEPRAKEPGDALAAADDAAMAASAHDATRSAAIRRRFREGWPLIFASSVRRGPS